jgi:hypothetical protein
MTNWICDNFPFLCSPTGGGSGGVHGPLGGPIMPAHLEWMQAWVNSLNDAPNPPTSEDISILANAFLAVGHADEARKISARFLENPSAFQIDINLNPLSPLTEANLQLIGVRSSASLADVKGATDLLQQMPSRDSLMKALQSLK